jgi:hypothetical protein
MSAYICNPETFGLLAAYAVGPGCDNSAIYDWRVGSMLDDARRVAEGLARENIRSVATRYPNDNDGQRPGPGLYDEEIVTLAKLWAEAYFFRMPRIKPVGILVLCQGYTYQACETDDWIETLAFRQIEWIRGKAVRALPGADDAPWNWSDEALPARVASFLDNLQERGAA